jgi:hypothetical protein
MHTYAYNRQSSGLIQEALKTVSKAIHMSPTDSSLYAMRSHLFDVLKRDKVHYLCTCICMYVYVCIALHAMRSNLFDVLKRDKVHTVYVCICICMYVYVCIALCAMRSHLFDVLHTYICIYIYIYIYIHTYMHTTRIYRRRMCVCIYIYIYIYIHAYMHTSGVH